MQNAVVFSHRCDGFGLVVNKELNSLKIVPINASEDN